MVEASGQSGSVRLAKGVSVPQGVLAFTFSRSGGPGGQNVNKLATRATLTVHLADLEQVMPAEAVGRLRRLAGRRYAEDPGRIVISAAEGRSQHANRRAAIARLREMIERAMRKPKRRIATRPPSASRRRRMEEKKQRGELKRTRRPPGDST